MNKNSAFSLLNMGKAGYDATCIQSKSLFPSARTVLGAVTTLGSSSKALIIIISVSVSPVDDAHFIRDIIFLQAYSNDSSKKGSTLAGVLSSTTGSGFVR